MHSRRNKNLDIGGGMKGSFDLGQFGHGLDGGVKGSSDLG